MEALKKAYADIAFNTTKEAAARIMAAERKAYQFQKQMVESKEEAARIIVRFKVMMDSKIGEAEILSLNQRKKIEELEEQLHKSMDVENHLKAELKNVKEELEKMKSTKFLPLDKHIKKGSPASDEDRSQENQLITSESILLYPRDSGRVAPSSSNMKNVHLHQTHTINRCFSALEDVSMRTGFQSDSPDENYYADNPDLPSIVRRRMKGSLRHQSGCKIRTVERNQLNKKSSFPIHTGKQSSRKKNKAGNMSLMKKDAMPLGELLQKGEIWKKTQELNLFRVPCWKRGTRSRKMRTTLLADQTMNAPVGASLSHCETPPYQNNSIIKSAEDPSKRIEETGKEALLYLSTSISSFNTTNMDTKLECEVDVLTDGNAIRGKSIQNLENQKKGLIEVSHVLAQEKQDAGSLEVPDLKVNNQKIEVPSVNCDIKDDEKCEMNIRAPMQTEDNKFLKFTFRRKRKTLVSPDENVSQENNILKKRLTDTESPDLEPPKSSLTLESSPDDLQLTQVAHQLVSLKDDKW